MIKIRQTNFYMFAHTLITNAFEFIRQRKKWKVIVIHIRIRCLDLTPVKFYYQHNGHKR